MKQDTKFSYQEIFSSLENIVKEVNRSKDQPVPIKIRSKSSIAKLDLDKPFVVLFGEQHPGSVTNEVNFAKTNRALLNTLVALYKEKKMPLKSLIKEGCSPLEAHKKIAEKSIEELLVLGLSPLQVFVNKIDPSVGVKVVESQEIFLEFALLSLLYSSRPGNARFSEIEMQRIMYIISDDLDYSRYMTLKAKTLKIEEDLKLFELFEEKFVKKIPIASDFGEFSVLALRSNIEATQSKDKLHQFDLRMAKTLLECGIARDRYVAETTAAFEPGLYPMFFGEYHINNLIKAFEELKIGYVVLSPFN